jgi:hypothetical protein
MVIYTAMFGSLAYKARPTWVKEEDRVRFADDVALAVATGWGAGLIITMWGFEPTIDRLLAIPAATAIVCLSWALLMYKNWSRWETKVSLFLQQIGLR